MRLEMIDIHNDEQMRQVIAVEIASNTVDRSGWTAAPPETRLYQWRAADQCSKAIIRAWEQNRLGGYAAWRNHNDEPETTWIFCWVDPQIEAQGIATDLIAAAQDASPLATRRFVASIYRPSSLAAAAYMQKVFSPLDYELAT